MYYVIKRSYVGPNAGAEKYIDWDHVVVTTTAPTEEDLCITRNNVCCSLLLQARSLSGALTHITEQPHRLQSVAEYQQRLNDFGISLIYKLGFHAPFGEASTYEFCRTSAILREANIPESNAQLFALAKYVRRDAATSGIQLDAETVLEYVKNMSV